MGDKRGFLACMVNAGRWLHHFSHFPLGPTRRRRSEAQLMHCVPLGCRSSSGCCSGCGRARRTATSSTPRRYWPYWSRWAGNFLLFFFCSSVWELHLLAQPRADSSPRALGIQCLLLGPQERGRHRPSCGSERCISLPLSAASCMSCRLGWAPGRQPSAGGAPSSACPPTLCALPPACLLLPLLCRAVMPTRRSWRHSTASTRCCRPLRPTATGKRSAHSAHSACSPAGLPSLAPLPPGRERLRGAALC